MENASQALIIAGAILLAILLIAIGMFIFNKANTSIQDAARGMDQNAVAVVNGKFTPYTGTNSGTQLKGLISTWGQYHAQLEADGADAAQYIKASISATGTNGTLTVTAKEGKISASEILKLQNSIKDLAKYTVEFEYDSKTGLINTIIIKNAPQN